MEADPAGYFDDWSQISRRHLCEASLRLLAALGSQARFPNDPHSVEAFLGRVAKGRPGEAMDFAVEPAGELPRYTGKYLVWISPAADGSLRLSHESGELRSEAVILRPDGRLGGFEAIYGFGVSASELTEQARADSEAVKRLAREREAEEDSYSEQIDDEQRRFRTQHLTGVRAAPPHESTGPIVTFVVLYETGVIVNHLVPRPSDKELESEDPGPNRSPKRCCRESSSPMGSGPFMKSSTWTSKRPTRLSCGRVKASYRRSPLGPHGSWSASRPGTSRSTWVSDESSLQILAMIDDVRHTNGFETDEAKLAARVGEILESLGAVSEDEVPVQAKPLEKDRVLLSAATGEHSADEVVLRADGILLEEYSSVRFAFGGVDTTELSPEQQDEMREAQAKFETRTRRPRFRGERFLRVLTAEPQSGPEVQILAAELFDDGLVVHCTFDQATESIESIMPTELSEVLGAGSGLRVEDDLGTEYYEDGGGGRGVQVVHGAFAFAPAIPPAARILRISSDSGTIELPL